MLLCDILHCHLQARDCCLLLLPFLILELIGKRYPSSLSRKLYHAGIATLATGSLVAGVLEIYGTTNPLATCYWYVGAALCLSGVVLFCIPKHPPHNT